MQKKNQKRAQKQTKSQKQNEELKASSKDARVIEVTDLELQHVTGGLAFCTTPWD